MKSVLMIAYHFPPLAGSSGIQRTLRFVQQLPSSGWQPLVLSTSPHAYERTSDDLLSEVPADTPVCRAFAFDTARHLAIRGRYLASMARPDRWTSWRYDGVRQGMRMVRQHRPAVIWSTYPIATAHVIGARLQQQTGLPWVADFRDPMAQNGYPEDPVTWKQFSDIEALAAARASLMCFTTPSAAHTYRLRYPAAADRIVVLENGYDEASFVRAESALPDRSALNPGCITLLHSGIVYPSERDPTQLFEALGQLARAEPALAGRLRLRFRAAMADDLLRGLADRHGVLGLLQIEPPIAYADALAEMLRADALLVMQAANCNEQVPAKIYEYLRAGRPIVTLTDPAGDTWSVLQQAGLDAVAPLGDVACIAALIRRLLNGPRDGWFPRPAAVLAAARAARSIELAGYFDRLVRAASARGRSA